MFFGAALLADGVLPGGQDFGAGAGRLEADGERLPVFGVRLWGAEGCAISIQRGQVRLVALLGASQSRASRSGGLWHRG